MSNSNEKTYWQLISESKAKSASSLKRYRDQMKIELDKYESYLKDIDSSLERINSTSYFIRGNFGTNLNNACESIKGKSSNVKKYTETSLTPAMDDVCRIRSDEDTIRLLEQGKTVQYDYDVTLRRHILEKARSMIAARNPQLDPSKININDIKLTNDGTITYEGYTFHEGSLSAAKYGDMMKGYVGDDISALRAEISKLRKEVQDYSVRPIVTYRQEIGVPIETQVSKYAPAMPTSLQVTPGVCKYAPAPYFDGPINTPQDVCKYAPAPAPIQTYEPPKYAPAPAPIQTYEPPKYAPAPFTPEPQIATPDPSPTLNGDKEPLVESGGPLIRSNASMVLPYEEAAARYGLSAPAAASSPDYKSLLEANKNKLLRHHLDSFGPKIGSENGDTIGANRAGILDNNVVIETGNESKFDIKGFIDPNANTGKSSNIILDDKLAGGTSSSTTPTPKKVEVSEFDQYGFGLNGGTLVRTKEKQ